MHVHTCEFLIKGLNEASTFDLVGIRHLHEYGDSVSDLNVYRVSQPSLCPAITTCTFKGPLFDYQILSSWNQGFK